MTPAGRIYTLARQKSLIGTHAVEFLVHLMRVVAEQLLVVWDGLHLHCLFLVVDPFDIIRRQSRFITQRITAQQIQQAAATPAPPWPPAHAHPRFH